MDSIIQNYQLNRLLNDDVFKSKEFYQLISFIINISKIFSCSIFDSFNWREWLIKYTDGMRNNDFIWSDITLKCWSYKTLYIHRALLILKSIPELSNKRFSLAMICRHQQLIFHFSNIIHVLSQPNHLIIKWLNKFKTFYYKEHHEQLKINLPVKTPSSNMRQILMDQSIQMIINFFKTNFNRSLFSSLVYENELKIISIKWQRIIENPNQQINQLQTQLSTYNIICESFHLDSKHISFCQSIGIHPHSCEQDKFNLIVNLLNRSNINCNSDEILLLLETIQNNMIEIWYLIHYLLVLHYQILYGYNNNDNYNKNINQNNNQFFLIEWKQMNEWFKNWLKENYYQLIGIK